MTCPSVGKTWLTYDKQSTVSSCAYRTPGIIPWNTPCDFKQLWRVALFAVWLWDVDKIQGHYGMILDRNGYLNINRPSMNIGSNIISTIKHKFQPSINQQQTSKSMSLNHQSTITQPSLLPNFVCISTGNGGPKAHHNIGTTQTRPSLERPHAWEKIGDVDGYNVGPPR